jgi:two-component system, LuxR family, response regulator TtrR
MESLQKKTLWVALVDDDEPVRDSMRWLLEANGFQARAFATADEFLAALPLEDLGCIVLDVRMPGMGGIELHDELLRREFDIPVLFVTGHGDVPMAVARMKSGAVDFLEKPFNDTQMCKLVRQCLDRAEDKQAAQELRTNVNTRLERLTGRERQVLDLIVAGRLNKQIADDLTISIKTVEAHRANIMDKLNARSMADLMKIALHAAEIPREGA